MKPMITLDMKRSRLRILRNTMKLMNDPEYVYICVNPHDMAIMICPCDAGNKDAVRLYGRDHEIASKALFYEFARLYRDLFDDRIYHIKGVVEKESMVGRFYLTDAKAYEGTAEKTEQKGVL